MNNGKLTPKPEHRFTFELWTVGNRGEIKAILAEIEATDRDQQIGRFSRERAMNLLAAESDRTEMASKGLKYERLDQMTIDVLFGVD
jgi:hypothetical protein